MALTKILGGQIGFFGVKTLAVSDTYTVTTADVADCHKLMLHVDASSDEYTITLPAASVWEGQWIVPLVTSGDDSYHISVVLSDGSDIDGYDEQEVSGLSKKNECVYLYSDGSNVFTPTDNYESNGWQYSGGAISDARLKENIIPIGTFNGFAWYRYNFITDPSVERIGVLAQEVEKIMPEAVQMENGIRRVNYHMLV